MSSDAAAPAAPAAAPAKEEGKSVSQWSTKKLIYTLRLFNLANGVLLIATGILVFITGEC
jgi:hypothetical protein